MQVIILFSGFLLALLLIVSLACITIKEYKKNHPQTSITWNHLSYMLDIEWVGSVKLKYCIPLFIFQATFGFIAIICIILEIFL